MDSKNINNYLENESLKNEFIIRNLDLLQVWHPTPEDIELENRQLLSLLDWVDKYLECRNRKKMEKQGYLYPPLSFDIDPDSDWLRFERWIAGKPIRGKLKDLLRSKYLIKDPDDLTDEEVVEQLEKLTLLLAEINFFADLKKEIPPRLLYEDLLESLKEEFELIVDGGWHLDGCTGYCPDCFQRPWCDTGIKCCWKEDDEAGFIVFPESVKAYVSPSPVSLTIIRKCQEEEDRKFKEFSEEIDDID